MNKTREEFIRELWGCLMDAMEKGKSFLLSAGGAFGNVSSMCVCTPGECTIMDGEIEDANIRTGLFDVFMEHEGLDGDCSFEMSGQSAPFAVTFVFFKGVQG